MQWARQAGQHLLIFCAVLTVLVPVGIGVGHPSGLPRITLLPTADGATWLVEDGDGRRILIGGGDSDAALRALSERAPPWQQRIDMLVLPPPFRQHLPGATSIVQHASVQRIIELGGPGAKPPTRYDPWQLATLDRGHIPERLWSHAAIPLAGGAMLDLIAPDAPDGVPVRLPPRAPQTSARTRSKPAAADTGADAAQGAFVRLSNGRASVVVALGTPDDTLPGFGRLIGATMLVSPEDAGLMQRVSTLRPWSVVTVATGVGNDTSSIALRTLTVPAGSTLTFALDGAQVRTQGLSHPPIWA